MRKLNVSYVLFFFFSSRRRHTRLQGDWSSDVCSSDLSWNAARAGRARAGRTPTVTYPGPSGVACTGTRARTSTGGRVGPARGLNTSGAFLGGATIPALLPERAGPSDSAITFIGTSTLRIPESGNR